MQILWLSPWMRPLARVQVEALARRGHEVLLVTSDQHPESDAARPYELVLAPHPRDVRTWAPFARAVPRVRAFGADVVVCELVRDPRWMLLAGRAPRVTVVHDDRPHDPGEQRPSWEVALFGRWAAGSAVTVVHSRFVATAVGGSPTLVPLTSDVDPGVAPAPAGADERRDFVAIGRLGPYKNLEVVLAAWQVHTDGPGWRGDELVLIGDGAVPEPLPPQVRRIAGHYRYADVLPVLGRAKASLVHYRKATQSGVAVLAMQLGVTPVVSPVGGLAEYQPAGEDAVATDDVAGLAERFDELAVPEVAAERGRRAREFYEREFAADVVAARWDDVLTGVVGARR